MQTRAPRLAITGGVLALVSALTLTACSSSAKTTSSTPTTSAAAPTSSSPAPTTSATNTAATGEITRAWEAFFAKSTPVSQKYKYLEKGQQHQQTIAAFGANPMAKQVTAKVKKVVVEGNQAAVTYDIVIGARPVLPNAAGVAVLENGQWKVSDQTLCGLLGLLGTKNIPGCM